MVPSATDDRYLRISSSIKRHGRKTAAKTRILKKQNNKRKREREKERKQRERNRSVKEQHSGWYRIKKKNTENCNKNTYKRHDKTEVKSYHNRAFNHRHRNRQAHEKTYNTTNHGMKHIAKACSDRKHDPSTNRPPLSPFLIPCGRESIHLLKKKKKRQ